MTDNLELIKPLLKFESSDDFYFLQVLQRKKENILSNSNSRVIKNYYINNLKYLEDRYEEIKSLCNLFNARAMLRLNKRSYNKVAFETLQKIANILSNGDPNSVSKAYDASCGSKHNDKNKKWILDIDDVDKYYTKVLEALSKVEHIKLIELPTKNGIHIITNPFRLDVFNQYCQKNQILVDIHKDNPVNLYIP
jgi:hypothetical protein